MSDEMQMDWEAESQRGGCQLGAQKFSTKAHEMQKKQMQEIARTVQ